MVPRHSLLPLDRKRENSSCRNMGKFSTQVEMIVYRFILSLVVGFFLGSYVITNHEVSVVQKLGKLVCQGPQIHRFVKYNQDAAQHHQQRQPRLDRENGLLYIGMMSMKKFLGTRVEAVVETWAKNQDVRLEIFASNNGTPSVRSGRVSVLKNGARIIQLPGVSDVSYPPQKKCFSMLKYIHDNHLKNFDWFLRVDDDAYIKVDALKKLLSQADPTKPYFIGHSGYGKHPEDYLADGENYCMGGTGILFSQELLRRIGPRLSDCLGEMFTEHEDIELGRCVRKITGTSCTESWETINLFYQNYGGLGSYDANIKEMSERKRTVALTFHANKESKYQYKFHQTILKDRITNMLTKITKMETEVKKMTSLLALREFDYKAWNSHAGYVWDSITKKSIYSTSSLVRAIPSFIKQAAITNVFYTIQDLRMKFTALQAHIHEISVTQMRYFVNPLTSVDMISRLKVQGTSRQRPMTIYLNNIHYRRTFPESVVYFTEIYPIDIQGVKSVASKMESDKKKVTSGRNERVNFIVALSGRPENLMRFLKNFEEEFLNKQENVSLSIVYFPEKIRVTPKDEQIIDADEEKYREDIIRQSDKTRFVQDNLTKLRENHQGSEINFFPVSNGLKFSRGVGLQMGAKKLFHPEERDELLFFCDVDLLFKTEILSHIRRSTIRGKQVYYPTFFSQYDPEVVYSYQEAPETHFYFEEIAGFWRTFSYGMVSLYKSDFLKSGGFDLSIQGWGLEDLRFCDAVLKKAGLQIFKSMEPAMVHIYHDKDCPASLSKAQFESCQNSRAQHFGPQVLLYYLWHREENPDDEYDPNVKVDP
uniref:chondroitin sulfate synthase 1-like n=1 Tax=Styela clava TaxID=7725 RepID=UPI00193AC67D|nr:chondroitin sulfate synthase 1-like [Styela clava]